MRLIQEPRLGGRSGGQPQNEQEHFIQCPACGRWIDMRKPGEVVDHESTCDKSALRQDNPKNEAAGQTPRWSQA